MANRKLTELTEKTTVRDQDQLYAVDGSRQAGQQSTRVSVSLLKNFFQAGRLTLTNVQSQISQWARAGDTSQIPANKIPAQSTYSSNKS